MMLDSGAITDDIKSGFVHLKTAFALGPKAHIFFINVLLPAFSLF